MVRKCLNNYDISMIKIRILVPLLDKNNSALVVIDVQENFLSKLPLADREPLV